MNYWNEATHYNLKCIQVAKKSSIDQWWQLLRPNLKNIPMQNHDAYTYICMHIE